ncbi:unnamed protein product, partial [Prorocentrum cordatum]
GSAMASKVESALQAVTPAIQVALAKYRADGKIVEAFDTLTDTLSAYPCLMWKQYVHADFAAPHPKNRGGIGVTLGEAFSNGLKHCNAGWSYKKACAGAFAVSRTPGSSFSEPWVQFGNENSVNQGLPPFDNIMCFTFGGSHCNAFLRAVLANSTCTLNKLAPSGRLIKDEMVKNHPAMERGLTSGLEWTLIHESAIQRFPDILEIGFKALNNHGTSQVSEMEGLMSMSSAFANMCSNGLDEKTAWMEAVSESIKTDPFWAGWSMSLVKLCKVVSYEQLSEARGMFQATVKVPKHSSSNYGHVGGSFIEKIANLHWAGEVIQHNRVRLAALLSNMLAPIEKIKDGRCDLLKESDVGKLTSKQLSPLAKLAEKMMDDARDILKSNHLEPSKHWDLLCFHDCRLVNTMLNKGKASREGTHHPDLMCAGQVFIDAVSDILGQPVTNPWVPNHRLLSKAPEATEG